MKRSKSNVRWPPALSAESRRRGWGRPAKAQWPLLSPQLHRHAHPEHHITVGSLASPTSLSVSTVTVSLCVVYITLNCNSLNKRPNCFFILVCTNFYINALHRPCNLDVSLGSKGRTAART